MTEQPIEAAMRLARDKSAECYGHKLGRFETCGDQQASAECIRPGCNMGLTVDMAVPGYAYAILGAGVAYHCASPERPLRDLWTQLYPVEPLEAQ